MTTLYGIKNCDTVKKARTWLETHGIAYRFHDFRSDGLDKDLLNIWLAQLSADTLINKRSTTWKQLTSDEQARINAGDVIEICLNNPTLIKRPVLALEESVQVGFSDKQYSSLLGDKA